MNGPAHQPTTGWTPERVERLQALRASGMSHARIADTLGGGLTKNAVIGKANRMGLASCPATPEPIHHPSITAPTTIEPSGPGVAYLSQRPGQCKEILSKTGHCETWRVCGEPTGSPVAPWCPDHDAIVWGRQTPEAAA